MPASPGSVLKQSCFDGPVKGFFGRKTCLYIRDYQCASTFTWAPCLKWLGSFLSKCSQGMQALLAENSVPLRKIHPRSAVTLSLL